MKLTKQKTWMMIEITAAAFLIISSCKDPGKNDAVNEQQLTQNIQPVFKPTIETISFIHTFFIYNP